MAESRRKHVNVSSWELHLRILNLGLICQKLDSLRRTRNTNQPKHFFETAAFNSPVLIVYFQKGKTYEELKKEMGEDGIRKVSEIRITPQVCEK